YLVVSEFILVGLPKSQILQILFFWGFSEFYLGTVLGNILIFVTVLIHTPIYFLLINLSCINMILASCASSKAIVDLFWWGCYPQMFLTCLIGGSEMMLLVAMATDRCVTICKPLHYMIIMSLQVLIGQLLSSYAVGFVLISQMAFMLNLSFCDPHIVDSFFCDRSLVIKLAYKDTYILQLLVIADGTKIFFFYKLSVNNFYVLLCQLR
uniref:G-protein coupled receptors family 1 profile domain-containing protein n=1 Tax=Loxodonta africana TaxID=9785 RepID=G3UID7_LOXAF